MELIWADHLLFVLLGILMPWRMVQSNPAAQLRGLQFDKQLKLVLYYGNSLYLWGLAVIVLLLWYFTGRDWSWLGLVSSIGEWSLLSLGVVFTFSLLYWSDTLSEIWTVDRRAVARREMREQMGFLPENGPEFLHYIILAITAGICEELVFRAYFIRYFQVLFGQQDPSSTLAIVLAAVVFGLAHTYQGWKTVVKITAMAVFFGFLFVHTGSIWVLIVIHILVDVIGGAIAWWLLQSD